MKKTISLLISIVCLFALSVCVFANEKPGDKLEVKLYCEVDGDTILPMLQRISQMM